MGMLGVLIPSVAFGGLFFFALPDQGWFDTAFGVLIWLAIVGATVSWAFVLFKDKKTSQYFTSGRPNTALEPTATAP